MSVDYEDEILKSDSDNIDSEYIEYARITYGNENSYFMKTEKITIGRNSADGTVDVDVGPHTFVSRRHLEMMYSYKKLKIKCLGKNGIFIDNYFKAHSAIPYELPYECTLRFPSTNIEVNVYQLLGRNNDGFPQRIGYKQDVKDCNDNRLVNRKRKAQKFNDAIDYNMYDNDDDGNELIGSNHHVDTKKEIVSGEMKPVNTSDSMMEQSFLCATRKTGGATLKVESSLQCAVTPNQSKPTTGQHLSMDKSCGMAQIVLNPRSYRSYSYSGDVIYTHNSQVFSSIYESKDLAIEYGTDTQKPPYSYAQLIVQAVSSSRDRQLTLNGIYNYISKHYPYFKSHDKGWQNSVRHNLSLNRYFIKVPRGQDEPGKGSFWRVDGAYETKLIAQAFRKRRLRSNNCGSICSDGNNIGASASRLFSLGSSGRAGNICALTPASADQHHVHGHHRTNGKLNNIFTVRRAGSDQKTATTFVLRKMGGDGVTGTQHQQLLATDSVFGSANLISSKQHHQTDLRISPDNVFHSTAAKPAATVTRHALTSTHKRPSIGLVSKATTASTLISIGGKLFSTNKLKPIQLLSAKNSTPSPTTASFVPLKQQQQHNAPSASKYILISTPPPSAPASSQIIDPISSRRAAHLITSTTPSQSPDLHRHNHHRRTHTPPSNTSLIPPQPPVSSPPLSVSETCEFALDEPSQLDSSSTELGPLSPSLRFSQSLRHDNDDDDDLDLEMDQFLDSYSILDHANDDMDSNGDLYQEEEADGIDDYCVWQDECLGLQDVEIEIH